MSPFCHQTTQNQLNIANASKQDHKLRAEKMEGEEGLNTVECLRGRLLAERQASKVANNEANSMGNKLVELEKKLRDEIELREKAERKLRKLKKKLQSLKLYSLSEKSEISCCRSPASSFTNSSSGTNETKTSTKNSSLSHKAMPSVSELSSPMGNGYDSQGSDNSTSNSNSDFFSHQSSNCHNLKNDESSSTSSSPSKSSSSQDWKNYECRLSGLSSKSSVAEYEDDDNMDNSLALVPVNFPITNTEANKVKPVHESVAEALNALKHAKEKLLCSMGTGHMIQVGPT